MTRFQLRKSHRTFKISLNYKEQEILQQSLRVSTFFYSKVSFYYVLQSRGACFREESKFFKSVICSLSMVLTSCQFTNETNREISRGVFQNRGVCGQAFPFLPTPSPFHFCFGSRSNFRAVTQLETLATCVIFLVISADDQFWTFK